MQIKYPSPFRILRLLILFILLALPTTCLVAWSCAAWSTEYDNVDNDPFRDTEPVEPLYTSGAPDPEYFSGYSAEHHAPGWSYYSGGNAPALRLSGWPFFALYSNVERQPSNSFGNLYRWEMPPNIIIARGLNTSDLYYHYHLSFLRTNFENRLALLPLWRGFLLNSLAYAPFLALLAYLLQPLYQKILHHLRPHPRTGFPIEITGS